MDVYDKASSPCELAFLGVQFGVKPISPAKMATALQVVCFFSWQKTSVMTGGSGELDDRLTHILQTLRRESHFRGDELESLLIYPPPGLVSPEKILLMGLGDPATLSDSTFVRIGRMAILEAIRLDVLTLALAPDIKDAGVTFPGANVSTSIATGMFQALRTAARLHELGFAERLKLAHVSLLAGHETLPIAQEGLRVAMDRVPPL